MIQISSLQNNRIRDILKLTGKARERRLQNRFVIEGARELSLALAGSYMPESVFVCPELFRRCDYPEVLKEIDPLTLFEVTEAVFQKIAYREGSDGIIAVAHTKTHRPEDLLLPEKPFLIVLESIEKPGNLGAVLRTADAAGADAVMVCDLLTDIYNPNVIRSSVGCLFTVPVAIADNASALRFLRERGIRTLAAELNASRWYHECDLTGATAIVMGTEADGLTSFWLEQADDRIKIPMRGKIDSLNVSVSTAILTFEAMRQRDFRR